MSDEGGPRPGTGPHDTDAARSRVDALFERFNTLTPAELAHIGLLRDDTDRRGRLDAVEAAARASGRGCLARGGALGGA